jgi:hypothetical protein
MMISPRSARFVSSLAVAAALCWARPALHAQGALSLQGFGYPGGQLSSRSLATGGSLADFDANSPINPASLLVGTRASVYFQYDPEFRWIKGGDLNSSTVTARFPLFLISGQVGAARFSLSYSSFLDRTWTNTYQDTQLVGTTKVASTVTAVSSGGISDARAAMSYTFSPRLTIGAAIHVFPGQNRVQFGRAFPSDSISFGAFSQTNSYNFSGSAASFGVMTTPVDHINLAASGRIGFSMHMHQGDSTTIGEAHVPNRFSLSGAFDGIPGTILAARYGTEQWSAMKGLGTAGMSVFDATEFAVGLETGGPRIQLVPMAVRLGYRARQLPFGVNAQQVRETEVTGGLGIPFSQNRAALDLSVAHAVRSANVALSETGWVISLGISIKPY